MGLLTDRTNNKLEKSKLINEDALNREPVPLNTVISGKSWQNNMSILFGQFLYDNLCFIYSPINRE